MRLPLVSAGRENMSVRASRRLSILRPSLNAIGLAILCDRFRNQITHKPLAGFLRQIDDNAGSTAKRCSWVGKKLTKSFVRRAVG